MTDVAAALLLAVILTGAVLYSIEIIYWATVALGEWIGRVFFHKTGTQERE